MTQKPKLSVGEKIAVYTHGMGRVVGVVSETREDGFLRIERTPSGVSCGHWFHVKQCRKLRPKQKPKKERVEIWADPDGAKAAAKVGDMEGTKSVQCCGVPANAGSNNPFLRLVECSESEVVLGREELARAWDAVHSSMMQSKCTEFRAFCERIGLGKDKA